MQYRAKRSFSPVLHKCKCGWEGVHRQLAIWLRDNAVVARICPACGNKVAPQREAVCRTTDTPKMPDRVLH